MAMAGDLILDGGTALAALSRAEVDMQIATAKQYPRSIDSFKREAMSLATVDQETASAMFYTLRRSGSDGSKMIEGPSVRMAEIIAYTWQNLRCESRVVSIDDKFVTAQATCFDIERNVAMRGECKRRITNKSGQRFGDDMIQVTANAACAIAFREAVFKVVPRAYVTPIFKQCQAVVAGKANELEKNIAKCFEHFAKMHVTAEMLYTVLGKAQGEVLTAEDLVYLRGLANAIKDGETTVADTFGVKAQESTQKRATRSKLNDTPKEPEREPGDESESDGQLFETQATTYDGGH